MFLLRLKPMILYPCQPKTDFFHKINLITFTSLFGLDLSFQPIKIATFFFLDPNGVVQRDLHNKDPEYLQYKFSYSTEMTSKLLVNR